MKSLFLIAAFIAVASAQTQVYVIGFNAYRTSTVGVSAGSVVVFDGVQTNVATSSGQPLSDPYNPASGYFTCPGNGVYFFHYTIRSDSLEIFDGEIHHIDTNGVSILSRCGAIRTQQGLDTASNACLLTCFAGQTVRVVAREAGSVYEESGKRFSNFGGHIVYGIFS